MFSLSEISQSEAQLVPPHVGTVALTLSLSLKYTHIQVGIIYFLTGILYVLLFAGFECLLPSRNTEDLETANDSSGQPHSKSFLVSMKVGPKATSIINKTIEEGGLYNLTRLVLAEVQRADSSDKQNSNLQTKIFPAPSHNFVLEKDDILVFTGAVDSAVDIFKSEPGLVALNEDGDSGFNQDRHLHLMYEAVISPSSLFLRGRRIRDINFSRNFRCCGARRHTPWRRPGPTHQAG